MKDGKLFGKINIIDLLVIIMAVVIVAAVALKMTGRLGAVVPEVGTNITYTVRVERVDAEVYENVKSFIDQAKAAGKTGDQLMSNGACLSAYVTDVTALPAQEKTEMAVGDNYVGIVTSGKDLLDLTFTVEGYVANNTKTELGSQEVRVGKRHIVKTTHFELENGTILSCEWVGGTSADN